ncbi:hypothetical protein JYK22_11755, partial [Nonomuraea sp. RK-328]|nr:hypothetical protein [Nonomuraea sp. RK-328]
MSAVLGPLHLTCKVEVEASHPLCSCQHGRRASRDASNATAEQHDDTTHNAYDANLIPGVPRAFARCR